jgi:RND family efflux transporter MFP subunit
MQKNSAMSSTSYAIASKALGVSLLFLVLTGCGKQQPEAQAPPPAVPVAVKDLNNNQVKLSSEFIGSLEAKQRVALAPRVDGRILDIAVEEGDTVKQGDLIVQLQTSREQGEVDAAKSQVNIQRSNVSNAEAELRAVEAEVASAEADVEQSRADLRKQEAEFKLAQTNLERTKFLVKQGAQSQQVLDDRTRDLSAAKAQTDALKASLNSSQKALGAAREKVVSARSKIAGQQAALEQSESRVGIATDNLEFNRVTAPIDGIVGDIQPKVGDYLEAGDQITSITKDDTLQLNVSVPLEQAANLKIGLPVEILDSQGKAIAEGDISFISPRAERNSQGVLVKAAINNNGQLKDDTVVSARVIWSEKQGILIPTESISRLAGKSFVFVAQETKQKDGKTTLVAKQKPVELGAIQGQSYQVISGLKPSDRLITSGILNLTDGALITTEAVATQPAQTSNR